MRLPAPAAADRLKKTAQLQFRGYEALGTEGAICDMGNMTSDYYPELAVRPKRKHAGDLDEPRGMGAGGELCRIDGTTFYYGDTAVSNAVAASDTVRTFAQLGDYITIWPDGKYYDTVSGDFGTLSASMSADGTEYGQAAYFSSSEQGISSQANVLGFGLQNLASVFRVGDAVTISGCVKHPNNNKTVIIRAFAGYAAVCYDDTFELDEKLTMTVEEGQTNLLMTVGSGSTVLRMTVGISGLTAGYYDILEDTALGFYYNVELPAMSYGDRLEIRIDEAYAQASNPMDITAVLTVDGVISTVALEPGRAGYDQTLTFSTVTGLAAGYYDVIAPDELGFYYNVKLPSMSQGDTLLIPVDEAYAKADYPMAVTGVLTVSGAIEAVTLDPGKSGWDQALEFTTVTGIAPGYYDILEPKYLGFNYNVRLPAMSPGDKLEIYIDPDYAEAAYPMTVTGTITVSGVSSTVTLDPGKAGYDQSLSFTTEWMDYSEDSATVTVTRQVPSPEIVFAHDNRLFGLAGDEIYVTKLGDPFNWNVFDGTASDSWATDTGTPGDFTAGVSYGGYPRFFKEDRVFTLYGEYPGEYELHERRLLGVAEGSGRSLAIGNGRLYYLSAQGPCVYAGGDAARIADVFGTERYKNGVGASDDVKYYLSMEDGEGEHHLFVYDTRTGLWMREDGYDACAMCLYGGEVWALGTDGSMDILGRPVRYPDGAADEDDIAWYAEFGDIAMQSPEKKRITKLMVRLEMEAGAEAAVKLKFDSEGFWRTVSELRTKRKRSALIPIVPRRTDHFRLRLEGTGGCRISSISYETAPGSERK